jgi:GT2 family glycosyltransferase
LNLLNSNLYSTASQLICELAYNHYNQDSEEASFFCTNNMAVPKMNFLEIGGFDERFRTAEDRDFCKRWKNYEFHMIYCPKAIIYHAHELTLTGFIKQTLIMAEDHINITTRKACMDLVILEI